MRQLGILLVLVGVGYLIYTQGLPRWEERKAAKETVDQQAEQSRQCVDLAETASRDFSSAIRQFARPPVDRDLWSGMLVSISGQLSSADTACFCPTKACDNATAALYELRGLVNDLDGFVRSAGPPVLDGASRIERVDRLLAAARASLLSG